MNYEFDEAEELLGEKSADIIAREGRQHITMPDVTFGSVHRHVGMKTTSITTHITQKMKTAMRIECLKYNCSESHYLRVLLCIQLGIPYEGQL